MINYLKGSVFRQVENEVTVLVNNVGYQVEAVENRVYRKGEEREFYIYTHVREDAFRLFGFDTELEHKMFIMLLSVSGVGPKAALVLLSVGAENIISAISQNTLKLMKVKGVGSKTLEKVTLELASKLEEQNLSVAYAKDGKGQQILTADEYEEVYGALLALGFKREEIFRAIRDLATDELHGMPTQQVLKKVLQQIRR